MTQCIDYELLPQSLRGGMRRYIEDGVIPGSFLVAVLSDSLSDAMGRADEANRKRLYDIVSFVCNEAPGDCWGSRATVKAWAKDHSNYTQDEEIV
jgi:hypothetical protein